MRRKRDCAHQRTITITMTSSKPALCPRTERMGFLRFLSGRDHATQPPTRMAWPRLVFSSSSHLGPGRPGNVGGGVTPSDKYDGHIMSIFVMLTSGTMMSELSA